VTLMLLIDVVSAIARIVAAVFKGEGQTWG
jgi:hypothetical protein